MKNKNINLDLPPSASTSINIPSSKKLLSKIYKLLSQADTSPSIPSEKWETDLSIAPDADFWPQICQNIFFMTTNANFQLIQYKIIHRTHLTEHKMQKMRFSSSGNCSHCSLNCTFPLPLFIRRPIHIKTWQNTHLFTSSGADCRQENYPHELEISELHTHHTLEKPAHRLHLLRKYKLLWQ